MGEVSWMIRILAALIIAVVLSARAEAATRDDWRLFLAEGANRDFSEAGEPIDFEDALYAAAQHGRSQTEAVARFAARIRVSAGQARAYADFIVAAVKHRALCRRAQTPACAFAPGAPFYDRVAREGLEEPSGGLLVIAFKNTGLPTAETDAAFIRLASNHPAAATIFTKYCCAAPYLVALLRTRPLTDEALSMIASAGRGGPLEAQTDGALEAAIEDAERQAISEPAPVRAALAQLGLARKLRLGLTREAVQAYLSYPIEIRTLVPLRPQACDRGDDACVFARSAAFEFADDLVAALWLDGREEEAAALARAWRESAGARNAHAAQRYAALTEAMAPRLSRSDLYALFIEGRRPGDPPVDDDNLDRERPRGGPGWLFAFERASAVLTELVATRLRTAGYESMADFLDRRSLYERELRDDSFALERFAFLFPQRLVGRRAYWAARIDDAWGLREARRERPKVQVAALAPNGARPLRGDDDRPDMVALRSDHDADGLTDIEEARFGLKVGDRDTDGDGMADAIDPLPLTPYDRNAPTAATSAAFEILSRLMGPTANPVLALGSRAVDAPIAETLVRERDPNGAEMGIMTGMIVADDPRLFAGVRTPFRLLIYSHADLRALNNAGVPIEPPELIFLFSSYDAQNHYVSWSGGFIGGDYFLRCAEAGGCDAEERSSWISH